MSQNQRERMFNAVEQSYRKLEPFRSMQLALIDEYAGEGYGSGRDRKREIIVNLLNQTVEAYMITLAANRPRVLVTTKRADLKPFAAHFQIALNNLLEEIGIDNTIRRWVLDAFFCIGIVKVHMANSAMVEVEQDVWADPGRPFASNISLDNWVHDTSAVKWSEMQFCGDVYRVPYEDLQDDALFDQKAVKDVSPSSKREADSERLENIANGHEVDQDELYPMVDLIDLWLPREWKIETYACDFRHNRLAPYGRPLGEIEWTSTEFGPYKQLSFNEVPQNIMPSSPASHLASLARHINNVYRKQIRSARDFKEVNTYAPGGEKGARNFQNARHGDNVCVQDPASLGVLRSGGVNQENQMFLLNMMNDFNSAAGNLSALLGLGPQAETVGQEKLIYGAAAGKPAYMAGRITNAVTELVRDLGHLMWSDRVNVIPGQREAEGLDGYVADASWTPDDREGDFTDYNLSIDVYSMAHRSPSDRANQIMQVLSKYAPYVQMLVMQGGLINFQKLNEIMADLLDLPRLKEIIQFSNAVQEPSPGGQGKPDQTSREYVRRSVPTGGTQQGRNVMQQQAWAGSSTPQQQAALATR